MPRKYYRKRRQRKSSTGLVVTRRRVGNMFQRTKRLQLSGIHYFSRWVNANQEVINGNLNLTNGGITWGSTGGYLTMTTPAAVGTSFASFGYLFNLNALPNATEFQNLFDSYRIAKVVVKISPLNTVSGTQVAGAPNGNPDTSGFLHYVIDHDDATSPATTESGIDELRQMAGYKYRRIVGNKPITIVVKPRIATTVYRTGVTSAYAQGKPNTWLDMAYPDVPHYGIKAVLEMVNPNATASTCWLRLETHYYLALKGVR